MVWQCDKDHLSAAKVSKIVAWNDSRWVFPDAKTQMPIANRGRGDVGGEFMAVVFAKE